MEPDARLEPYDQTLKDVGEAQRRAWSRRVLKSLEDALGDLEAVDFEIHAGSSYMDHGLVEGLLARDANVLTPVRRLRLGAQLSFYKEAGCL